MRIAILSDIHANEEALRATLLAIEAEAVDRILCLGDIVGYNANPAECAALLRQVDALCVAGNHDRAATGQIGIEGFGLTAARAITWTRRRLDGDLRDFLAGLPLKLGIDGQIVAVHGALHPDQGCELVRLDNDERRLLSFEALAAHPSGARICAYGHTHRAGVHEYRDGQIRCVSGDEIALRDDAYYLVNPGTVGEPRTGDVRASFAILDMADRRISIRRVAYDRSVAVGKTRKAGLAPPLSFLPEPVRAVLKRGLRAFGLHAAARETLRRLRR